MLTHAERIDGAPAYFECATELWSPCCDGYGLYADVEWDGQNENNLGFRCTECNKDYPADYFN